jgi:hypothetical protein
MIVATANSDPEQDPAARHFRRAEKASDATVYGLRLRRGPRFRVRQLAIEG